MQVLVVEDSAVYRKLICDQLTTWGFHPLVAGTAEKAWQALSVPDGPKLVLLDWVLPDQEGVQLCRRIRQAHSSGKYVYVILLTCKEGRQNMLDAMQAGADDYLLKPFDEATLRARLLVGKRILTLQDELIAAREAMRHAATHDSLTGLVNRAEILRLLQLELERARRERKPVSVVLADIDHFKAVNDTLGHLYGDEALKEIARRLRARMRIYDGIGRYGGEEFLLVFSGCDLASAEQRADELRQYVASTPLTTPVADRVVTVSMGVATWNGTVSPDLEALLNQADHGLYAAKQNGRNRVECAEEVPA